MISDDDRARIAKLPSWARDLIKRLEYGLETLVEDAAKSRREATKAKEDARRYSDANAALMELLGKAGQSGLDWAATVVSTLEGYEIYREIGRERPL